MSRERTLAVMQRIETLRWALAARQQAAILSEHRRNAEQRQQIRDALAGPSALSVQERLALLALLAPAAVAEEQRLEAAARELEGQRNVAERKLQRAQRRQEHLAALVDAERAQMQRRRDQREDEQSAELWHTYCKRGS